MMQLVKDVRGQMTVELAIVLPVVIIIAVICMNALQFFAFCASFDRASHQAVRVFAASPSYGNDLAQCCSLVEGSLRDMFLEEDNISIQVSYRTVDVDLQEFVAHAEYSPTIFGLYVRDEVLGVPLPHLTHSTRYVIDSYRPGVLI